MALAIAWAGAGCAARKAAPAEVRSVQWMLESIDGFPPPVTPSPTATFDDDRVWGRSYINHYRARCELNADGTMWTEAIDAGRNAGPPDWQEYERQYLARLRSAKSWRLKRDTLTLTVSEREGLTFTRLAGTATRK